MTAPTFVPLEYGESVNFGRFALAAAVVLAAHVGLTAGYLLRPRLQPEGAALAPAVIVDLAPLPAAPASVRDVAPGPEMVEQPRPVVPAPAMERHLADPPPKVETPAEVALALPKPRPWVQQPQQPVENERGVQDRGPAQAERRPPAPRTSAAPRFEQHTASASRAPSPGSAANRAAIASWRDLVAARLQQSKRYPNGAASRREEGVVTLSFSVNRNGRVLSRRIVRSSGYSELDLEVLALLDRVQPLPPFPPTMTQSVVHLSVPIHFSLR
jgi:protein TonB